MQLAPLVTDSCVSFSIESQQSSRQRKLRVTIDTNDKQVRSTALLHHGKPVSSTALLHHRMLVSSTALLNYGKQVSSTAPCYAGQHYCTTATRSAVPHCFPQQACQQYCTALLHRRRLVSCTALLYHGKQVLCAALLLHMYSSVDAEHKRTYRHAQCWGQHMRVSIFSQTQLGM